MADNKLNQEQLYALLQYAARRLNVTPTELAEVLSEGRVESLVGKLSPDNAARLQSMMGDSARAQQLLQSPQAQALMKKLLEK